jgi:hypothetical protein
MENVTKSSITIVLGALITASTWSCGGNSEHNTNGSGATANSGGSSASGGSSGEGGDAASSGGTESGGASSGGPSTGGAAGNPGGGSGGTSTGEVATLGDPCSTPGALACAGNHQKLTLLCSADETWEANETCDAGQFCDSTPGPNVGSCRDALEGCEAPEDNFCDGNELWECGPDTVTSELVEECIAGCQDGACLPGPGPGDEPCPESPALADCSNQCGPVHEDCGGAVCEQQGTIDLTNLTLEPGRILVRTPVASSIACGCEGLEPPLEERFGFWLETKAQAEAVMHVAVSDPWFVSVGVNPAFPSSGCLVDDNQCTIVGHPQAEAENKVTLYFWTRDPNAGSVNVVISEGECD